MLVTSAQSFIGGCTVMVLFGFGVVASLLLMIRGSDDKRNVVLPKVSPTFESSDSVVIPEDVKYTIEDDGTIPGIKRSLDVRLNKKVPKEVLRAIAITLKNADHGVYQRTFISYYVPSIMKTWAGTPPWATTNFNPDLVVRVVGLLPNEEKALLSEAEDPSHILIGRWLNESTFGSPGRISIYRQNGILYMDRKFKDGSNGRAELVKHKSSLGQGFEKKGLGTGEYYVVDRKGDLQIRDGDGLIETATRIP